MELGMVDAEGETDFSGMDGTHELFIEEVYHRTFVAVDEAGTKATAASAVVVQRKGGTRDEPGGVAHAWFEDLRGCANLRSA